MKKLYCIPAQKAEDVVFSDCGTVVAVNQDGGVFSYSTLTSLPEILPLFRIQSHSFAVSAQNGNQRTAHAAEHLPNSRCISLCRTPDMYSIVDIPLPTHRGGLSLRYGNGRQTLGVGDGLYDIPSEKWLVKPKDLRGMLIPLPRSLGCLIKEADNIALRQGKDMQLSWIAKLNSAPLCAAVDEPNGMVIVLTSAHTIHCLSIQTGDVAWKYPCPGFSSMGMESATIRIGTDGRLAVLGKGMGISRLFYSATHGTDQWEAVGVSIEHPSAGVDICWNGNALLMAAVRSNAVDILQVC